MDNSATDEPINADAAQREAAIRRREIILKIEEHATGYQRVTGAAYRYIAEMVNATPDEWEWIKTYIAEHPDVLNLPYHTPTQWDEIHRTRGQEALRNAEAADISGDRAAALDHLDEARAYGAITRDGWQRGREYLQTRDRTINQADASTTTADERPERPSTEPRTFSDAAMAARKTAVRQRQLLLAIEQHGPSLRRADSDWLRHTADIANATEEERDWMAAQVSANPHLLDGDHLGDGRISDINRKAARRAFTAATEAIGNHDYTTALDRLDDAETHWPTGHPDRGLAWDHYRTIVLDRSTSTDHLSTPNSNSEASLAGRSTMTDPSSHAAGPARSSRRAEPHGGPATGHGMADEPRQVVRFRGPHRRGR